MPLSSAERIVEGTKQEPNVVASSFAYFSFADDMKVFVWADAVAQTVVDFLREHHLKVVVWVFLLIGAMLVVRLLAKLVKFVVTQFFRRPHDLQRRYGADSWAVISGSSGGIGLGFAVELAKRGFHIVLISRSEERLCEAEAEVHKVNPAVKTKRVIADFTACHQTAFWDALDAQLQGLDVSILVNNVGINHTESFSTIKESLLQDMIHVNCTSQMIFTRRMIRRLLVRTSWGAENNSLTDEEKERGGGANSSNEKRKFGAPPPPVKRSAIISVSSVAGQRPLLFLSPYSATKAFNDFFSRALALEFPEYLDVLSLRPGYVVSNMSKLTEAGGFVLDRYECARGCLDKLGYVNETYGDPRHAVYARSFFLLPESVLALRRRQRLNEKSEAIAREKELQEEESRRQRVSH